MMGIICNEIFGMVKYAIYKVLEEDICKCPLKLNMC